jgi:hypothetical protein
MNTPCSLVGLLGAAVLLGVSQPTAFAARLSDLAPVQTRTAVVKVAQNLSIAPQASTLPADLVNPFNPPEFDQPSTSGGRNSVRSAEASKPVEIVPLSDQEILDALARRFRAGGVMTRGDASVLTVGGRPLQAGQVLVLTYDGREYEVEIVSIEGRSFTLRYRDVKITRSLYGSP